VIRLVPLLLLALVPTVQSRVDAQRRAGRAADETLYLWSGAQVRRLAPGLETLMADVYWLRTVQYFGGQKVFAAGQGYPLLEPLINITVTLDPRMEIAYRYGAIFLSEPRPNGAGRPQAGVALLERGVATQPENWRLRQDLGFYTFLFLHDAHRGAEILDAAADLPGAPIWLRSLAADVLRRGGERATARRIWQRLHEQAEDPAMRDNALLQLAKLDALDEADRLAELARELARRTGRRPRSLDELVGAGLLSRPPVDIAGVPFEYDPETGAVVVGRSSPLRTQP
jgi:hypothetical protein